MQHAALEMHYNNAAEYLLSFLEAILPVRNLMSTGALVQTSKLSGIHLGEAKELRVAATDRTPHSEMEKQVNSGACVFTSNDVETVQNNLERLTYKSVRLDFSSTAQASRISLSTLDNATKTGTLYCVR